MKEGRGLSMIVALVVFFGCFFSRIALADSESEESEKAPWISVACHATKPTVEQDGEVVVTAWARTAAGVPLDFVWTATAGTLAGRTEYKKQTSKAVWSLHGTVAGPQVAVVQVSDAEDRFATCSVPVRVLDRTRAGSVEQTGRALLRRGQVEESGYAVYSYLLLGSDPGEETHSESYQRYRAAVDSYLRVMEATLELEKFYEREGLNITYLPVKIPDGAKPVFEPEWFIEHYDYPRAQFLFSQLEKGSERRGPYLVSCSVPLVAKTSCPEHRLIQDLSSVPPRIVSLWVEAFINQVAQERYWEERVIERIALKIRTTIEIASIGLPDVRGAVRGWIEWSKTKEGESP